jgi:RNA polymerase sigma-B factor
LQRDRSVENRPDRSGPPDDRCPDADLFRRLPDASVRHEIFERFEPMARHLALRFQRRGIETEDLIQLAYEGLLNAIDRFEVDRGTRFASFATPTITGVIKRHFRDLGWSVGVPRRMKDLSVGIRTATETLSQRYGRSPSVEELADHLDVPAEEILEIAALGTAYRPDGLDAPVSEDSTPLVDLLGSEDPRLVLVENLNTLGPILAGQPDREFKILALWFGCGWTQREIAQEIGMSQMHVSRLLSRSIEQMRQRMDVVD